MSMTIYREDEGLKGFVGQFPERGRYNAPRDGFLPVSDVFLRLPY